MSIDDTASEYDNPTLPAIAPEEEHRIAQQSPPDDPELQYGTAIDEALAERRIE